REELVGRRTLERRQLPLVIAGQQPEAEALTGVRQRCLEAVPRHECSAALIGEEPHGQLREGDLPFDAGAARVVSTADPEGVLGAVGQRPHLQERGEAVALEHRAPGNVLVTEVVGPRLERLLPARAEQRVDLPAALGELAVGEDPLLADLHDADAAREPRWAGDDVGHALSSDETGRRRTALDGAASFGVEPEARGRGTGLV